MRNVRQNLFFALGYNAVGIPVAAGVLYPAFGLRLSPILAAIAMAASSLSVVGNANRLRRYRSAGLPPAEPVAIEPQVEVGNQYEAVGVSDDHAVHDHAVTPGAAVVTDPVCGMQVDPQTAAARRDTETGPVYFCSDGCAGGYDTSHSTAHR
jgi:Cu+-exporting ATPase